MNTKLSQDYITLELHKVLDMLAQEAANEKAKELARALVPETDSERVRYALRQTEDAFALSVRYGSPSFDSFDRVCESLRHTQSGARVSLKELLEIARLKTRSASPTPQAPSWRRFAGKSRRRAQGSARSSKK